MAAFKPYPKFLALSVLLVFIAFLLTGCLHDGSAQQIKELEERAEKAEKEAAQLKKEAQKEESTKEENAPAKQSSNPETTSNKGTASAESGKKFGYIKRVYTSGPATKMVIDYAEMLTGAAARRAAIADGDADAELDFYIRNRNPLLRTFNISNSASITMETWRMTSTGKVGPTRINLAQFKNIFNAGDSESKRMAASPYWITLSGGTVVKIREQYLP